jgi:ubiquinone/menaquinone biosynthesis C-methylase UbiE
MPGHVDRLNRAEICGWATRDEEKTGDIVSISVDDEEIALIPARLYNRELEEAVGVGKCAFRFTFSEALAIYKSAKITVRSASTGKLLGKGQQELPAFFSDKRFAQVFDWYGCAAHPIAIAPVENGLAFRIKVLASAGAELAVSPLGSSRLPLGFSQLPPSDIEIRTVSSTDLVTTYEVGFVLRQHDPEAKVAAVRVRDLRADEKLEGEEDIRDFAGDICVPFSFDWLSLPPKENYVRTSGNVDLAGFAIGSVSAAHGIYLISQRMLGDRISRVLDWGVGCGRVAVPLKRVFLKEAQVLGVDVDNVNVEWCKQHLKDIRVEMGEYYPPLNFEDDSIDVIYGISVMTHLTRDMQAAWLRELSRILRPGGVCILTTHGGYALSLRQWPVNVYSEIERLGISDSSADDSLGQHLAIRNYYRGTFQLRSQVEQEWSRYLKILAFIPAGSHAHQDLVVMTTY